MYLPFTFKPIFGRVYEVVIKHSGFHLRRDNWRGRLGGDSKCYIISDKVKRIRRDIAWELITEAFSEVDENTRKIV